jgi:DME family drug/metabolite transporter
VSNDVTTKPRFTPGSFLILIAAALWGTTGTAAFFAPKAASPLSIGAATMGLGGLILLARAGKSALQVLRSRRLGLLLCGMLMVAVYPLAFYSSMAAAGIAVGTVVTLGSAPVFAAVIERVLDGVRLDRRWALAIAASLLGVFLLATGKASVIGGNPVIGALLGLLAGWAYALYSWTAGRMMRQGHSSRAVMGAIFGSGSMLLLPVLALTAGPLLTSVSGLVIATYLALVPMGMAYVFYGAGLRDTPASTATTLSLLEPVVATVLSVLVAGEQLTPSSWIGVALIGAGLALVTTRRTS